MRLPALLVLLLAAIPLSLATPAATAEPPFCVLFRDPTLWPDRAAVPAGEPYAFRFLSACDFDDAWVFVDGKPGMIVATQHRHGEVAGSETSLLELHWSYPATTPPGTYWVDVQLNRGPDHATLLRLQTHVTAPPQRDTVTLAAPATPALGPGTRVGTSHTGGVACLDVDTARRCTIPDAGLVPNTSIPLGTPGTPGAATLTLDLATRRGSPDLYLLFSQGSEYQARARLATIFTGTVVDATLGTGHLPALDP